jgi:hypothetical protein
MCKRDQTGVNLKRVTPHPAKSSANSSRQAYTSHDEVRRHIGIFAFTDQEWE